MNKFFIRKIFYIGFLLFLISNMFSNISLFKQYGNFIDYIGIILMFISGTIRIIKAVKENQLNYDIKKILIYILIGLIALISALKTTDKQFIKLMIIIYSCYGISFDSIIKYDFSFRLIFLVILFVLSNFGIINNNIVLRGTTKRLSFGFSHPNSFAAQILMLYIEYVFIKKIEYKKITKKFIAFSLSTIIITIFIGITTNCRTVELLIVLFYIYILLKNIINKIFYKKFFIYLFKYLYTIFLAVSFILAMSFKNNENQIAVNRINSLLSGRINYSRYYIDKYNVNLLGNKIYENDMNNATDANLPYYPFDNGYIYNIVVNGALITIILMILFSKIINKTIEEKKYDYVFIIVTWLIFGIFESCYLNINYNIFLLLMFKNYLNDNGEESDKNAKIG